MSGKPKYWRLLNRGELRQNGDEFKDYCGWWPIHHDDLGTPCTNDSPVTRRPCPEVEMAEALNHLLIHGAALTVYRWVDELANPVEPPEYQIYAETFPGHSIGYAPTLAEAVCIVKQRIEKTATLA